MAACLLSLSLVLGGCSPAQMAEAARLLADLSRPPGAAADDAGPAAMAIQYDVSGRAYGGDLYQAALPAQAHVVLVPGAAEAGKDDPRLRALARALARRRFAVLVPDIASLRALRVSPGDIRVIADAVLFMADRPARRGEPVGVAAISYAAGPALIAALDPEAGRRLDFVVTVGGYHDMTAAVTFFTTGYYRHGAGAAWRHMTPNAYGKWLFVGANADRLGDQGDTARIAAMARRKLADPAADIADLADGLGWEGRALYALLVNRDPDAVPGLIAALPESIRADMRALDPARHDLSRLQARLLLVHGRDDAIIPYTESLAIAAAAPPGGADLYLVDRLAHVDFGVAGIADAATLAQAAYRLLGYRGPRRP